MEATFNPPPPVSDNDRRAKVCAMANSGFRLGIYVFKDVEIVGTRQGTRNGRLARRFSMYLEVMVRAGDPLVSVST